MAVRKIIRMGHPTLRRAARTVPADDIGSDAMHRLVADMIDTLHDYGGIGLAAPQINESIRLAIVEIPDRSDGDRALPPMPLTVCINPSIAVQGTSRGRVLGRMLVRAGGYAASWNGPSTSKVTFTDLHGQRQRIVAKGFLATLFQHEFDHLDGTLYVDHVADPRQLAFEEEYARYVLPTQS